MHRWGAATHRLAALEQPQLQRGCIVQQRQAILLLGRAAAAAGADAVVWRTAQQGCRAAGDSLLMLLAALQRLHGAMAMLQSENHEAVDTSVKGALHRLRAHR